MHMFVKSIVLEGIFNFRFGTVKDENLIVYLAEFIDSKYTLVVATVMAGAAMATI